MANYSIMARNIQQFDQILVVGADLELFELLRLTYEPSGAVFVLPRNIRFKRDVPKGTGVVIIFKPGLPALESERLRRVLDIARTLTVSMERLDDIDYFLAVRLKHANHGEMTMPADNTGELRHLKFVLAHIPDGVDFNTTEVVTKMRIQANSEGILNLTRQKLHIMVSRVLQHRFQDPKFARFRVNNINPLHDYDQRKRVIKILRAEAEAQQAAPPS